MKGCVGPSGVWDSWVYKRLTCRVLDGCCEDVNVGVFALRGGVLFCA